MHKLAMLSVAAIIVSIGLGGCGKEGDNATMPSSDPGRDAVVPTGGAGTTGATGGGQAAPMGPGRDTPGATPNTGGSPGMGTGTGVGPGTGMGATGSPAGGTNAGAGTGTGTGNGMGAGAGVGSTAPGTPGGASTTTAPGTSGGAATGKTGSGH